METVTCRPRRGRERDQQDEREHGERGHCQPYTRAAERVPSYALAVSLAFLPALEQARLVREGEVSSLELVDEYLERIERFDPQLNAFVTVCAEEARAEARSPRPGPSRGVPLPIKDLTETAGIRTTFSSKAFADHVPTVDAEVVRRIREAGFVLLGKTNTPEFGTTAVTESELNGICRNPWDPTRTPGGSSGGAAAAVAAGMAPLAHGTDGGGSIRIPASCCGVFGLKPARGRVSPAPRGDVYGFSVSGADRAHGRGRGGLPRRDLRVAPRRSVRRTRRPSGRSQTRPPRHRAGCTSASRSSPRVRRRSTPSARRPPRRRHRRSRSSDTTSRRLPNPLRSAELTALFGVVWRTIPALYPFEDESLLEPLNAAFVESARAGSSADYVRAFAALQVYARALAESWARFDVVLTPTLAKPPLPVGWVFEPDDPWEQFTRAGDFTPFTPPVNMAGLPAASVPFAWTEDGLPIGIHLIGRAADEATLIRLSAQLEAARPWADRLPPGFD